MNPLSVEVIEHPAAVVLCLKGEARLDPSPLEAQTKHLLAQPPALVILDMAALSFCASVGMRSIFFLRQRLGAAGTVTRLAAVQPDVLDSFKRAALLPLFEVFANVDEAMAAPIR